MFMCEKGYRCCYHSRWDTWADVNPEVKNCSGLIELGKVTHSHWILNDNNTCSCSNCGTLFDEPRSDEKYCGNCGAKMDEMEFVL